VEGCQWGREKGLRTAGVGQYNGSVVLVVFGVQMAQLWQFLTRCGAGQR
jgi:hypothetical protein